ncbi:N-6 DNA methylase [uncultured Brevundimonas sp.]|uniref:Eco57I restriction-modification methylase domain-containing protein n=1 Tax=uncultured Brevundimonas sp. TaxID=213418 RepID=UPI0026327E87|nr:N-6 DNA methylase [uncultured Brevundimonas sp.]
MELFASAGIDLPSSGSGARKSRALSRTLHVPLFNHNVVEEASRGTGVRAFVPTPEQTAAAVDYARKVRDPKFLKGKETAVRHRLIEEVLQTVLGYAPYDPGRPYSLALERPIRGGSVDVALGAFNRPEQDDEIVAPFELKGPDSADLDRIMPGRGRSPVQQAWDYAIDAPGSRWVLVSNCLEIRLYAFGRGRDAYERFDLTRLDDRNEHERLWRILSARSLFGGHTDQLLRDTDSAYKAVTDALYKDYAGLRGRLIDFLRDTGEDGPGLETLKAIEVAQKLLDRILFIAFAQRTDLMQDRLLKKAAEENNDFAPYPQWRNFQGLFRAVDKGRRDRRMDVPAYNGGLFAEDAVADTVVLPDHLAVEMAALGEWDYRREVPVTVLGRLFEQSITDIEALKSGAAPEVSRRKREGVVYTPDSITRFVVEQTIGRSLDERRAALWDEHGMWEATDGEAGPGPEQAGAFWRAYLEALRDFTIVDPACGSGAFLVAAFDEMARRYRDAVKALEALEVEIDFDVFDEIVTKNLYGVDLNPESVEITRLSLWLKTARRDHRLQNLEATIRDGNSLIADAAFSDNPFDWTTAFPEVRARGGFDVVIGNPPYVRMEHLKPIKPYLSEHYVVADDRTDLYAYFFEKGVAILKTGGRLGYISSSTFFKTGSGEKLRSFLGDGVGIEDVVDFGDVQVFEGVTTYPAILTLKKGESGDEGQLRFLGVTDKAPEDLGRDFARRATVMPRARLGKGSWQFENDALAALRARITAGRKTLGEVYGAPLYGIKTGLNEAFVIDRATRDRLVAADARSAELLKPFLRGENIKRWRIESDDLFLINTPKGQVDIEAYPTVRDWLAPFREALEKRATKQEWWELQQAQVAYQDRLGQPKIAWPHFQHERSFVIDRTGTFLNNKCFFIAGEDPVALALLNSQVLWFQLVTAARAKRGGYIEAEAQYVGELAVPDVGEDDAGSLDVHAGAASTAAAARHATDAAVRRRILDLAPPGRRKLTRRLEAWHDLDFAAFRAEVKSAFKTEIPLKERGDWEAYLAENAAEVHRLTAEIAAAEARIDAIVYRLFDLTPEEIALLESSIAAHH